VTRRPLLRATVTSVVSYAGIGMLIVCCPVLGAQRLGGATRGALLISAIAAGIELCAAAVYLLTGRSGRRSANPDPAAGRAAASPRDRRRRIRPLTPRSVRNIGCDLCYAENMRRAVTPQWWATG
jgi:hypothetical protein